MVDLWGRRWTKDERAARIGVFQRYPRVSLPHHITWRQLGAGPTRLRWSPPPIGTPGASTPAPASCSTWAPDEQRGFQLQIGALLGAEVIDAFAAPTTGLTVSALTTHPGGRT